MEEIELDNWFFNLPAAWQMNITAIYINESMASEVDYEKFNSAVTEWWDSQDYDDKLMIYKNELRSTKNKQGKPQTLSPIR